MNQADEAIALVRRWLSSSQSYDLIRTFSKKKLYSERSLNKGSPTWADRQSQSDLQFNSHVGLDDLTHDFLAFLLQESEKILPRQPYLVQAVLTGKFVLFLDLLWKRHKWRIQEKARNKTERPLGHLYRRFREVLRNDELFLVARSSGGDLFYTLKQFEKQAFESTPEKTEPVQMNFSDWPVPPFSANQLPNEDARITKKWLSSLAYFFWQQAHVCHPATWWFAANELVRYLGFSYPWLADPLIISVFSEGPGGEAILASIAADDENVEAALERKKQVQSISVIALQLVLTWSKDECCVFSWRVMDHPRTFEDIAKALSLGSHNKAYAIFDKTKKSIRAFCASWPGPPLQDMSEEISILFVEILGKEAKKICGRPLLDKEVL